MTQASVLYELIPCRFLIAWVSFFTFPCIYLLTHYLFVIYLFGGKAGKTVDNLLELALSSHDIGSGDQMQVIKLGSKCLYLMSHSTSPNGSLRRGCSLMLAQPGLTGRHSTCGAAMCFEGPTFSHFQELFRTMLENIICL